MLTVFHFILDHRIGGPHVYVRALSEALGPDVKSMVVTTGQGEFTDLALTNLRHSFRYLYPVEVVWNVIRLGWIFRNGRSRADCIFDVHGIANIAPAIAARLFGIPFVWHIHETIESFGLFARLGKAIASGSRHRFVAVAQKSATVFRINDAMLIPGGVDVGFWQVTPVERQLRGRGRPLRLVAVGNINPLKGVDILLDAVGALKPPWELVVVGAELATYRDFARRLHEKADALQHGHVEFVGWQSPERVRQLLAAADVFVLPSRSEACPIALLEAMAMECVCVATDVGDVAGIIDGPGLGLVVASDDAQSLSAALDRAARMSPSDRQAMGERAREAIVRNYSRERMASRHLEVYRSLAPGQDACARRNSVDSQR